MRGSALFGAFAPLQLVPPDSTPARHSHSLNPPKPTRYGANLDRHSSCKTDAPVRVMITDTCPCHYPSNAYSNKRWCCGDERHMDLSWAAFEQVPGRCAVQLAAAGAGRGCSGCAWLACSALLRSTQTEQPAINHACTAGSATSLSDRLSSQGGHRHQVQKGDERGLGLGEGGSGLDDTWGTTGLLPDGGGRALTNIYTYPAGDHPGFLLFTWSCRLEPAEQQQHSYRHQEQRRLVL